AGGENYCTHHEGSHRTGGPALLLLRRVGEGAFARHARPCLGRVARLVRSRLLVLRCRHALLQGLRALGILNLVRLRIAGVRLAPLGRLVVLSIARPTPVVVLCPSLAAAGVAIVPEWPKVRRLWVLLSPATAGAVAADTVTATQIITIFFHRNYPPLPLLKILGRSPIFRWELHGGRAIPPASARHRHRTHRR